jgi:hypothetical protein
MKTLFLSALTLALSACYMSKPLETAVHVTVTDHLPVSLLNSGNSRFCTAIADTTYQRHFKESLKKELQVNNVFIAAENPQYEISFTNLTIQESTRLDTVKDAESPDHGKIFELTTLRLNASGQVKNLHTGISESWSASNDESEKVTSFRALGQMVNGENKERNEYREKAFENLEPAWQAGICGRRSAVMIVKEIQRF